MNASQLQNALENEWENMHHNASIIGHFPDMRNEYESSLFWDTLSEDVSMWIDCLKHEIKEKYGQSLSFYQYGRMGATIAPDEFMSNRAGNGFGSLNYNISDGLDGYNEGRKILSMFRYINKFWGDVAKNIPEWWKDCKDANGYDEDILEHDGLKPVMRKAWAKA